MAVITFASSKGGAGKTTSAIILATTLAKRYNVVLLDADPARRAMSWADKGPLPLRLQVQASQGEKHIHNEIDQATQDASFVVLDLEGAATRLNAYAMGESDLVVIPMGDEQPDAEGAIETLSQLQLEARALRREIPVRILFCRTQAAVKSRLARSLNEQVRAKIGAFSTELHTRSAFSSLHNTGGWLYSMDQKNVTGVNKAIANAELFAEEVMEVLRWGETIKRNTAALQGRTV
jgi:chromosome partitioning protein